MIARRFELWAKFLFLLLVCLVLLVSFSKIYRTAQACDTAIKINNPSNNFIIQDFYPNIAVLVENRPIDMLITVVHNVFYHLPSSWPIQIFHTKSNENFIRSSTLAPLISSGRIILTFTNGTFHKNQTNYLLTDAKFWQRVRGEKILFFQLDSMMCSNSPHKITDFLQYDYVGAPWDSSWFAFSKVHLVGNGGFSLRSRSKVLALIASLPYDSYFPEDVWYGMNLHRVGGKIPSVAIAKTFAVESIFYERPLGVHRFALPCYIRNKIILTCPEAKLVMPDNCF